jgi:hypothetical protein
MNQHIGELKITQRCFDLPAMPANVINVTVEQEMDFVTGFGQQATIQPAQCSTSDDPKPCICHHASPRLPESSCMPNQSPCMPNHEGVPDGLSLLVRDD